MSSRLALYDKLYSAVAANSAARSSEYKQAKVKLIWDELNQKSETFDELSKYTHDKIKDYRKKKNISQLDQFLSKAIEKNQQSSSQQSDNLKKTQKPVAELSENPHNIKPIASTISPKPDLSSTKKIHQTPAQLISKEKIAALCRQVDNVSAMLSSSTATPELVSLKRKLDHDLLTEEKKLKKLEAGQLRQLKHRQDKRARIDEICDNDPRLAKILKTKDTPGRPRVEHQHPELLQTIMDIASFRSGESDNVKSVTTLDDLHQHLNGLGITISRSATYLRLLPRKGDTEEGRRHTNTVPIKLENAHKTKPKPHMDSNFCEASNEYLRSIASLLGPDQVFYLSQDNKARVLIGITSAEKQQSVLMRMQYKITIPDKDWVKADRQKLIPSIYSGCVINENGLGNPETVTSSGPTIVRIRSGKHNKPDAASNAADFVYILKSDVFKTISQRKDGSIKPIIILSSDNTPDENPRYEKVIKYAIQTFKTHKLDALFLVVKTPNKNVSNPLETKITSLSNVLDGLLLDHKFYGAHLDNNGKTIDEILEKDNYENAAEVLCELWSSLVIDKYPVEATYVEPKENMNALEIDQNWFIKHVRCSEYLLQIIKCDSELCCEKFRSNLRNILTGFFPHPMKIASSLETGIFSTNPLEKIGNFLPLFPRLVINISPNCPDFVRIPYDFYCPSLQSKLHERICEFCELYFVSKKSVIDHFKIVHNELDSRKMSSSRIRPVKIIDYRDNEALCISRDSSGESIEWINVSNIDENKMKNFPNENIEENIGWPIVEDLKTWMETPWAPE